MDSVKKSINGITITVDKRTMLLGIIMHISNYCKLWKDSGQFDEAENKYLIEEIKIKFSKYRNEKIIKLFDELTEDGDFSFDAPLALFLQLDDSYKTDKLDDYVFTDRLKGNKKIFEFIYGVSEFADKIGFDEYYEEHKDEYEKYVNSMAKAFESYDVGGFFKDYYGMEIHKRFNVNLIPFITRGAFSCDTSDSIFSCLPIYSHSKKENLYDLEGNEKYFLTLPIHEFSHGFVNPLTDNYKLVDENTHLFDDIREEMSKQAYPTDVEIINEHIVRAITARSILYMHNDQEWYDREIERQKEMGFIYIEDIISSLEIYEKNRDKYNSFNDYYPEIIRVIKFKKTDIKKL